MNSSQLRRPVLVFDIDGTLLVPRGVGRAALNTAFFDLFGLSGVFDTLDFAGATDYEHFAELCRRHPLVVSEFDAPQFFSHYTATLARLLKSTPLEPLPGVHRLVSQLSRAGWRLTLGTGNTRTGAYTKLGAAGLAGYFPSGGFSEPGRSRPDIVAAAVASYPPGLPAVVIGDTPRDVDAAHAMGLPVLGVATGRFSPRDLEAAGADVVLTNLTDSTEFLRGIAAATSRQALPIRSPR